MKKSRAFIFLVIALMMAVNMGLICFLLQDDSDSVGELRTSSDSTWEQSGQSSTDIVTRSDALTEDDAEENTSEPDLVLHQNPNCPLPWEQLVVQKYDDYPIKGSVESRYPIEWVRITLQRTDASAEEIVYLCTFDSDKAVYSYDFFTDKDPTTGKSLDKMIRLDTLKKGDYSFTVCVGTTQEERMLYNSTFTVDWFSYKRLTPAVFRNNYAYALEFFGGDIERFMFGYKISASDPRQIVVEGEWRSKYLQLVEVYGKKGYVHVDTVPYLDKAIGYTNSTYIRVQGNGRDSGIILLSDIVEDFAGAFVPRFVRNDDYISHHSFGTALDLNAYTAPNTLNRNNWEIIRHEVADCLIYNGIKTEDGITYYDFEYTGSSTAYYNNVPRGIQNYLIYELAFFRAGFGWGYYFSHNCDAMHYTLTELDPKLHSAEGTGLRKVFDYIADDR